MEDVDTRVRAAIAERGPLPFPEVMELALYDDTHGFYAAGGRAGRGAGDFITSPEVGPLFGAVVARALDLWWLEAGQPERITVVEAGAGPGTLARAVLAAQPQCGAALRYILVERSVMQATLHGPLLERYDNVESRAAMPLAGEVPGLVVVLANELLDNLPFHLAERTAVGWREVHVGLVGDRLVDVLTETELDDLCERLAPEAAPGARIPLQLEAMTWVREALELTQDGGRLVVFDYTSTTWELALRPWDSWLRTYRRHERCGSPLEHLGTQDITCEVAVDQLRRVRALLSEATQADWLRSHGIDLLVDEGRRVWRERAHIGDLEAVRARSRTIEAEALLDESGLGAFTVLEW